MCDVLNLLGLKQTVNCCGRGLIPVTLVFNKVDCDTQQISKHGNVLLDKREGKWLIEPHSPTSLSIGNVGAMNS